MSVQSARSVQVPAYLLPLVSQRLGAGGPDGEGRGRAHGVGAGLRLLGDDGLAKASPDSCQEHPGNE